HRRKNSLHLTCITDIQYLTLVEVNIMANKLALVTGASSGIGLSLAADLAKRGYDLVVCSAGDRLKTTVQQLQVSQVEVVPVQADLATSEGIESLWEQVVALGRNLDIACINAGVG